MADKAEFDLDVALDTLAREAQEASPRPGPDLVARVLADAGDVSAGRPADRSRHRPAVGRRRGLSDILFGWTSGALASMAVGLVIGLGVGLEVETLPMLDPAGDQEPFEVAGGPLMLEVGP